ncbi:hypothetical protein LCGC14_0564470, partial [marine sediment metagenome]
SNDTFSVLLSVDFKVDTEPIEFSGSYSYSIEVTLDSIKRELLLAKGGQILKHKLNGEALPEITLVDRNEELIKYLRMTKSGGEYHFEHRERSISNINKVCTTLLWDESREPYMEVIRSFLKEIGGYEFKFIVQSKPKLFEFKFGEVEFDEPIDFLSLVFHYLKSKYKGILDKLEYYFRLIYDDFIEFKVPSGQHAETTYMVEKSGNQTISVPTYFISDGTKSMINILSICLLAENYSTPKLIIIDEIENSLHPNILRKFLEILKTINIQLIITTHSPVVLRYLEEGDIKIMYREENHVKISQGLNRKALAEDFEIDIDEVDIIGIWIDGDDTDLIKN